MKRVVRFLSVLIWRVFTPLFFISLIAGISAIVVFPLINSNHAQTIYIVVQLFIFLLLLFLYYYRTYKKGYLDNTLWYANTCYAFVTALVFTITFMISQGSLTHPIFSVNYATAYLFFGTYLFSTLFSSVYNALIVIGIVLAASVLFTTTLSSRKKYLPHCAIVIAVLLIINLATYFNSPNYKYQGHGFEYMNGYSSVDLSDYTPYSNSGKLVTL